MTKTNNCKWNILLWEWIWAWVFLLFITPIIIPTYDVFMHEVIPSFLCDFKEQPVEWVKALVPALAAVIAIISFLFPYRKNSDIKTIENVMALEKDYREHLTFLLDIEIYYKKVLEPVLDRELKERNKPESYPLKSDRDILDKLDRTLRHFSICSRAKTRKVINEDVINDLYEYYLMLVTDNKKLSTQVVGGKEEIACFPDGIERVKLGKFVYHFWPNIYEWSKELYDGFEYTHSYRWKRMKELGIHRSSHPKWVAVR